MREKIIDILWGLTVNNSLTVNMAADALMELIEEEKKAATCEAIAKIAKGLASGRTLK